MQHTLDIEKYARIARQAAAEGCVLLKNDKEALPLRDGDKIAIFGRCAFYYYKSGLGSGGLVNTGYVVSILDALKRQEYISLEESLLQAYEAWIKENPVDEGHGWGTVPWSQAEMPVSEELVKSAKSANVAMIVIGRTAGEDQDNKDEEGSYRLTQIEKDMISKVCKEFERTIVLLNVGNIIDMSWVEECKPAAVMYVWQGGQEGGNGVVDVLTGQVSPCGKLSDTIAYHIEDYPSTKHFGDARKNYYKEDIYVGYRYFETFAKEKVQYPFGFGLSYTDFTVSAELVDVTDDRIRVKAKVTNTGKVAGKEVVQVYIKAPQGELGKPARVLAGFAKTKVLAPAETQELVITCPKSYFASYDDAGLTGNKSCFLLEEGEYGIYVGTDVRGAVCSGSWKQGLQIMEQLEEACAPIEEFDRLKAVCKGNDSYEPVMEQVPVRTIKPEDRIEKQREAEIPYTGKQGYLLGDVFDKKITLDRFVAQLSDEDLMCLFRGEGMCSPKVTPGTAGAFGGLTDSLRELGVPPICCADGPSGIRMDCGTKAFSLPNGTALGCTFNLELVRELFVMLGREARKNKVDTLLGPGVNIHRSPLNGRNFEYISEDPILTGKMGAVQIEGMQESGVAGTIKHYCANNQEWERTSVEAAVSERALREIYLKVYEMAVKEAGARSVMTTYGPLNGIRTAGNYDLCTVVLRNQWNYKGIVMTDWWANANWEGEEPDKNNRAPMVLAQNDIYMCCVDSLADMEVDNVKESLEKGIITRSDLQRNAKNILTFIMESPAMLRELGRIEEEENDQEDMGGDSTDNIRYYEMDKETERIVIANEEVVFTDGEFNCGIAIAADGEYSITFEVKSDLTELAQLPVSLYVDNLYRNTFSFRGTNGETVERTEAIGAVVGRDHFVKLVKQGNGLDISRIEITKLN